LSYTRRKLPILADEPRAPDGRFVAPIAVRAEGESQYRLIAGHHRLEAWKRCFGTQRPILANVYPPDTPDALITVLVRDP
jgi:hypothetical protein